MRYKSIMRYRIIAPLKLSLALAISGITFSSLSHATSLYEIYQLALKNDPEFRAARANLGAGLQVANIGRSALLPQINASAEYSTTETSFDMNIPDSEADTLLYGVSLSQTLFDGSAWYSYKQSKANASASEIVFQSEEQRIILRVAEAYFLSLQALDNLETALAEETSLAQSLEQTKQRFEVGLTAITGVHEAQARFDSARANRLLRESDLIVALEGLEVLTGESYSKVAPLKADFPVTPPSPLARTEWEEMAATNNLSLKNSQLQSKASEANYKSQRSRHLPKLSAQLGYNIRDSDGSDFDLQSQQSFDFERETTGTSAAITLSVPIFSGGRISAQREQAAAQFVASKEQVSLAERRLSQQTRSLYQRVVTGVATVEARRQAIVSSESALEATQAGYDVGTRNLVDVLDAQRAVYAARRDFLSSLYDYVLSGLQLKEVAGILNEQDIQKLDGWLNKTKLKSLESVQKANAQPAK